MTPTPSELLLGGVSALAAPSPEEEGGEFRTARFSVLALLCLLLAQEVEKAAAVRAGENRAIRSLFKEAVEGGWAPPLNTRLSELGRGEDLDLTLEALGAANGDLRRTLIHLHEAVEAGRSAAGRARERRILRLLRESAEAARLDFPYSVASA